MNPELILVPVKELEKLEKARFELLEFLSKNSDVTTSLHKFAALLDITAVIWRVANTRNWLTEITPNKSEKRTFIFDGKELPSPRKRKIGDIGNDYHFNLGGYTFHFDSAQDANEVFLALIEYLIKVRDTNT